MSGYAIRNDGVYGCRAVAAASDCAGNEVFSRVWLAAAPPLAHIKATACSRIDAKAEMLCTTLITPGITQQTRYARKLAQAQAFLQDGTPTEAEYPLIYNEVGITASNAGAVAMAVVQAAEAYDTFCDKVELVRAKAKGTITGASNASLVASAEAAVVWPVAG